MNVCRCSETTFGVGHTPIRQAVFGMLVWPPPLTTAYSDTDISSDGKGLANSMLHGRRNKDTAESRRNKVIVAVNCHKEDVAVFAGVYHHTCNADLLS
jgi:hypothetical protein